MSPIRRGSRSFKRVSGVGFVRLGALYGKAGVIIDPMVLHSLSPLRLSFCRC